MFQKVFSVANSSFFLSYYAVINNNNKNSLCQVKWHIIK
jgi:hypothetical protein